MKSDFPSLGRGNRDRIGATEFTPNQASPGKIFFERNANGQSVAQTGTTLSPELTARLIADHPGASVIGIIAPAAWPLIQAWHACLDADREPIILHYPTPKLSRVYWQEEIGYAVTSLGVSLLICADASCVPSDLEVPVILLDTISVRPASEPPLLPETGSIIQMSSGTTGHRKGIRFAFEDVRRHVADYNRALGLTSTDCVVSWLPLYHDMGFIAAYLMPRLLGARLVIIDPIEWVRRPEMLFEVIEEHGGTVCYMPNFGFEVMAAHGRPMPTMRRWISCSEPTRAPTMARFAKAVATDPDNLSNCWGMAENIFGVTLSRGIRTRRVEEAEVVSCGSPLPGVEVKAVDGEIYVRSPYSLRQYIGGGVTLDAESYYASGDLGIIEDGEIFLLGRKHDVINVAGRKMLANDIDFAAAQEVPESAGRICTFTLDDPNTGTERPIILIEHTTFWKLERDADIKRRIAARTGVENARVTFVPRRFITKTSSGKVNRKTTKTNWMAREHARARERQVHKEGARAELAELFPWLDADRPVGEQIDSLGFVNMNIVLAKYGVGRRLGLTDRLRDILTEEGGEIENKADNQEVFRIASLCDANVLRQFAPSAIQRFAAWEDARSGRAVQLQHLCVPPASILLSDLIFHDYFQCRDPRGFEVAPSFNGVIADLKQASVLIVDDAVNIFWPQAELFMVYPELSHDFRAAELAQLVAVRWARYSENHHLMPCTVRRFSPADLSDVNPSIARLASYLGIPVIRVAYGETQAEITKDWEVQGSATDTRELAAIGNDGGLKIERFEEMLFESLERIAPAAPTRLNSEGALIDWNDQAHWCSWPVNPDLVDFIFQHFSNCVVLGKPSSIPYLSKQATERGIKLRFRSDLHVPDDCDCVIMTGSWGRPETDKPIIQVMPAGFSSEHIHNVSPDFASQCPHYLRDYEMPAPSRV